MMYSLCAASPNRDMTVKHFDSFYATSRRYRPSLENKAAYSSFSCWTVHPLSAIDTVLVHVSQPKHTAKRIVNDQPN